jgi:YD repeat-containing protein
VRAVAGGSQKVLLNDAKYDEMGRLRAFSDLLGRQREIQYDLAGRIQQRVTYANSNNYIFDARGHLTQIGGEAPISASYDLAGRLRKTDQHGVVAQYIFRWTRMVTEYKHSTAAIHNSQCVMSSILPATVLHKCSGLIDNAI